jgi:hypothetical protein
MRNRHVESTGKEDEVLLDENLVERKSLNKVNGKLGADILLSSHIPVTLIHPSPCQGNPTQLTP